MSRKINTTLLAFTVTTLFGFINAQAVGSKDLFRCRQSCYQKFVKDWHHCMDFEDCRTMCITPPNINSYIPEAFSFLCWNNCDQVLGPFPLNINSALRQGSLVLTNIAWDQAITNASKQCLVTWEVSGGGLMGNLLTDSSTVELSLWPDTVYHVQVTCKHKETGGMRRSYKLIVDTHKLSDSTATGMQAITMDTGIGKTMPNFYGADVAAASSGETDSRMRILKDSSKDFLSPYNPNVNVAPSKNTQRPASDRATTTTPHSGTTRGNAVLRTKLVGGQHSDDGDASAAANFLTQSVLFAAIGSLVVFLAVLALCLLLRPAQKAVPAGACLVDREVLIHSEMLPSQTPAALASKQTSVAHALPGGSGVSGGGIVALTASDSQTLHV